MVDVAIKMADGSLKFPIVENIPVITDIQGMCFKRDPNERPHFIGICQHLGTVEVNSQDEFQAIYYANVA
jgi:hypothetical protein